MNSLDKNSLSSSTKSSESWYNEFAEKLLTENFLLTALEFHAELTESGKELPKLRDYFSNPGNFEKPPTKSEVLQPVNLPRSSSQGTLDSLDLARYSEDGERSNDDKVAVLEFELRKAKETINFLRANLTEVAEGETNKFRQQEEHFKEVHINSKGLSIKPHEQRALNFLINEYLLLNGYKLTSITFADENESQDFEDWNDVGLNCARPLELLQIYREGLKGTGFSSYLQTIDFECQVSLSDEIQQAIRINELESQIADLTEKINAMNLKISKNMTSLENLQTGGDSQRSLTPDPEHFKIIETVKIQEELETKSDKSLGDWTNINDRNKKGLDLEKNFPSYLELACNSDKTDSQSGFFESGDNSKYCLTDSEVKEESQDGDKSLHKEDIKIDDQSEIEFDHLDIKEKNNVRNKYNYTKENSFESVLDLIDVKREMSEKYKSEIFKSCDMIIPTWTSGDILSEWFQKTSLLDLTTNDLINVLSECLPKIIPNIILNKREEITPLLVLSVCFNKNLTVRDQLLNLLFNFKKKPDAEERRGILKALLFIAKVKGSSMVENEILPQCWEQLTHKYTERRMLVAESCFLLAPYVSETIRNSLIISIVQQLMQDREKSVRKASVYILTILIVLISDENKYSQILEICINLFNDESTDVINPVNQLLLPTFAQWSLSLNKIQSDLFSKLLCKVKHEKNLFVFNCIEILLPYLIITVANSEFLSNISLDKHSIPAKRQDFCQLCKGLCDPSLFFQGSVSKIMGTFDFYTSEPNFQTSDWPELEWIMQVFIPDLIEIGDGSWEDSELLKVLVSILRYLCLGLGKNVTNYKVKPYLLEKLLDCENAVVSGQDCKYSIIPLYLVGVLSTYPEELQEMSNTLRRFICALPLCGVSLIPLQVTVEMLSQYQSWHILVLDAIWEGVVHQRPLVRSGSAVLLNSVIPYIPEGLLSTKIMPALVTLTSDSETSVRISAAPALGMLISTKEKAVEDKVYLTFQTLLQDSISLENKPLMIQLVKTISCIYERCELKFRDEVVVSHFATMTAVASRTKSKELVEVLIDAFSVITCSQTQVSPQCILSAVIPGLRNLEEVCNNLNLPYSEHVDSMIKEVERFSGSKESASKLPKTSPSSEAKRMTNAVSSHIGVEDMKNRVTKIFNARPNSLHNVSGIFKKKNVIQ